MSAYYRCEQTDIRGAQVVLRACVRRRNIEELEQPSHTTIDEASNAWAWARIVPCTSPPSLARLDEEKATDSKLNTMALKSVNRKAA